MHIKRKFFILLVISFLFYAWVVGTEKIPIAEPPNLLELGENENNIVIIDYERKIELINSFHVIHQCRVKNIKENPQHSFLIFKNALSITVTENIKNSRLEPYKNFIIYDFSDFDLLEFRFPQFLEESKEFILTIQYYLDFKKPAIYRNFWRFTLNYLDLQYIKVLEQISPIKDPYQEDLDRVSFILPRNTYLWKWSLPVEVTGKIKEVKNIEVNVEERMGVSWFVQNQKSRSIELGFGTLNERLHWENKNASTWHFILTLIGLFLAITVPIRFVKVNKFRRYRHRKWKNIILFSLVIIFCVSILGYLNSLNLDKFPIETNLCRYTISALITLIIIHFALWIYTSKYVPDF